MHGHRQRGFDRTVGRLGREDVGKGLIQIRPHVAVLVYKEKVIKGFVEETSDLVRCLVVVRLRVGYLINRLGKKLTPYRDLLADVRQAVFDAGALNAQLMHLLPDL